MTNCLLLVMWTKFKICFSSIPGVCLIVGPLERRFDAGHSTHIFVPESGWSLVGRRYGPNHLYREYLYLQAAWSIRLPIPGRHYSDLLNALGESVLQRSIRALRGTPRHPEGFQLLKNYRSHGGIVECANAIIELLQRFPGAIDLLRPEAGIVGKELPNFFHGEYIPQGRDFFLSSS